MGPFDLFQKKGSKALQPQPLKTRKQIVPTSAPQKPLHPTFAASNSRLAKPRKAGNTLSVGKQPAKPRSPNPRKRAASAQVRLEYDSEEGDSDVEEAEASVKRVRLSTEPEPDASRVIRDVEAFTADEGNGHLAMVHAADIAAMDKPTKFRPAFPQQPDKRLISLHYPSASQMERYELVDPLQSDEFNTLDEIREVIIIIIDLYLPASEASLMQDDTHGLLRRLKRAMAKRQADEYIDVIQEWNSAISRLGQDGSLSGVMDSWRSIDLALVERILTQTYSRTVSPRVGLLKQYENGTDNVYGELLPKFVSDILRRDTQMTSDKVFVDLGSGVGNVVLQAALQVGCESWGCEMMENACELADLQRKEFNARCRLWGLAVGSINLERGNFLENSAIGKVLKRADVVLVNNQAFTPDLNEALTNHFLDLKEGCLIVSLKSFVPAGHKITARNLNRACNVLEVAEKKYYSSCVSWTDAPGTYFVSKKDSSRVAAFAKENT